MIIRMSIDKSSYCRILKVINEKLVLHLVWTMKKIIFWIILI